MTTVLDDSPALAAQRSAADPTASVWVVANAGSGKTRVLTDRVIRLLLARTPPHAILCLTFTKAAAAEMANRLHQRLGRWAILDEPTLKRELHQLLGRQADGDEEALARQLFARTLDAGARLRIQTIHAFCESLLKRFPLEAGVQPHFAIADDATAAQLLDEACEHLLATAGTDPPLAAALAHVVGAVDESGFREVVEELVGERRKLRRLLAAHKGDVEALVGAVWTALGVLPADTPEKLRADFAAATPLDELRRAASALEKGAATDRDRAAQIRIFTSDRERVRRVDAWIALFLTKDGEPRKTLATAAARKADPGAVEILEREQQRVVHLCGRLKSVGVARSTAALLRLGKALLDRYDAAKRQHALLDYDDLILAAGDLLRGDGRVQWVLFKLDGGIDHILVDEAQDTSPEQWDVIAALAAEFFAGQGARERPRTVFAVGDGKQSIFSFQGADPEAFARMHDHFGERVKAAKQVFFKQELLHSFRSTAAVLGTVDAVFAPPAVREGVGFDKEIRHHVHRRGAAGLVEVWPVLCPSAGDDPDPWAPLDYLPETSPAALLARRIAATVRRWIDEKEMLESRGRPIRPGDVLILVRKRDAFFDEMVRALKAARVPVAGADRMVLGEQLAVMDLLALARFVLLPEDDLNLATVLKGPLFGLDDDDLLALCYRRRGRLWAELRDRAGERPRWRAAADELSAWLARADYVPPFEFFSGILGAGAGRARILARLGSESADPIDEFLSLTLAFEAQNPPTLQGFLHWFASGAAEVKRDMEQNRDEARVMTIHGAKGLEANIVFMPDTCSLPDARTDAKLLWTQGPMPLPLWPVRSADDDAACTAAREIARRLREREYRRLLYVGLTRARDRLYICGWQGERPPAPECWYNLIAPAVERDARAAAVALPWGEGARRIHIPQEGACETEPPAPEDRVQAEAGPRWTDALAPAEPEPPRPLAPSRPALADPAARSPLGGEDPLAFRRGILIHRLLQTLPDLPDAAREAAAARFLARPAHGLSDADREDIRRETLAVIRHPDFAPLFGPGSAAEVPVVGRVGARVISGQVDRILVRPDAVMVLDYKTSRPAPAEAGAVPAAYLAQMAAYRAALGRIYPGRPVRCFLLWTDRPQLMELPAGLLDAHAPADVGPGGAR